MFTQRQVQELLGALAHRARERGTLLTKTRLVKFLYLLDLYWAQEHDGSETATGWDWEFVHFGPWCSQANDCISLAERFGFLLAKDFEGFVRDEEVRLYGPGHSVDDHEADRILDGLSTYVRSNLTGAVREFGADTAGLLDMVYFRTGPMEAAKPRDRLDFSKERKPDLSSLKPLTMKTLSKTKLTKLKDAMRALAADERRRQASKVAFMGPVDEAYESFLAAFAEDETPVGLTGTATIVV